MRSVRLVSVPTAAALAFVCACGASDNRETQRGASEEPVARRGALQQSILLTGDLEATTAAVLAAPKTDSWTLAIRWMEEDGAAVHAGQKLLEFDNSSFAAQLEERKLATRRAKNQVRWQAAQNAVDLGDRNDALRQARIAVEKATLEAGVPEDSLPKRIYQDKQLALERAVVARAKAEDAVTAHRKSAALAMKIKRLEVTKAERAEAAAVTGISKLSLSAPRDGVMTIGIHPWKGRKFQNGDNVRPGMVVMRIPDPAAMQVTARLSDVDDGRVTTGMKAECILDAYPRMTFSGTVDSISPIAREIGRNSLRRAFQVIIKLEKTDERMRPGMSVKVKIIGKSTPDTLLIPRVSMRISPKSATVRRADGSDVAVKLGACTAVMCAVEGGLDEGTKLGVYPMARSEAAR